MLQRVIPVGHELVGDSATFDIPTNSLWAATTAGGIVTIRLLDGRIDDGFQDAVGVVPLHEGLTIAVVEASGSVLHARRDQAVQSDARAVVDVPATVLAGRRRPDSGRLLVPFSGQLIGGADGPPC